MKVIVKKPFADKFTKKMYNAGQELDFDDERAASLIERELAEAVATSQQEGGNPEEIFGKEPEPDKPRELNQTQQKALRMMGAFLNANM